MSRTPFFAANWKMNHGNVATIKFITEFTRSQMVDFTNCDVVICPSFTSLNTLAIALQDFPGIGLGAQNCHHEDTGAFTGEISAEFLKELGCQYVIVGHSERRQFFGETDELITKKMHKVFEKELTPIFCIGETEAQREAGQTFSVIERQLKTGMMGLEKDSITSLVIAYEPVWAIGTGKTATPAQAQEVHGTIRKELGKLYGTSYASQTRLLYGGSVKPANIGELMAEEDIDGALVGGASLKPGEFLEIVLQGR